MASARLSSGRVISSTPAVAPKVVSGWPAPSTSIKRRPTAGSWPGEAAVTTPFLSVSRKRRPSAVAQAGNARASSSCGFAGDAAVTRERRLQALGGDVGDRIERDHHVGQGLSPVLEQLHARADADGGQKGDDENGDGAAEQGLCGQQPPVSRLGDRLRETLDGIGMCRRTRQAGARHGRPPSDFP